MLTAAQLDAIPEPIVNLYREYEDTIIIDIARRLGRMDMTSTAAWQMQRLIESGAIYEHALTELARVTGRSEQALKKAFEDAGLMATRFDDVLYRAAGLNPLPLNLSPAMIQVLVAGLRRTNGVMRNLTATTAIAGQEAFMRAADLAYMQVTSGAMSYDEAITAAIKNVAKEGLRVIQFGGHADQLDVAMRRTVLTGVNKTVIEIQLARLDEMGVDLVEVSAHVGARNKGTGPENHESWQGKIFSYKGTKYPDFVTTTGVGTGEGLGGWNCRHSFAPFPKLSQRAYTDATLDEYADKKVTYNGKTLSFYEGTQVQRGIERKIRYWKRQAQALQAGGQEHSFETGKVKEYQTVMRDFIRQTGLDRQNRREQVH
jgi:hypothetical protein